MRQRNKAVPRSMCIEFVGVWSHLVKFTISATAEKLRELQLELQLWIHKEFKWW